MEFVRDDSVTIPDGAVVKVTKAGHVVEVSYSASVGAIGRFRRLSKDEMLDTWSGEVIEVVHGGSRQDHLESLRRTIKRLRDLINANFYGEENELFITLTYAENVRDTEQVYRDFKVFYKRLRRRCRGVEFRYIAALEPQERGAWHLHLLLKALSLEKLFLANDEVVERLWEHGWTKTKRLESVDNVGAYLSAYLTDLEGGKKGSRLHLYPAGVNIYRHSRNCVEPEVSRARYGDIKKELGRAAKTYEVGFRVVDVQVTVNRCKREYFNLLRQV